jgi:uncharacterized membrane protein
METAMDFGLLIARIVHVVGGVLWVGTMYFLAVFLGPALGDVGPEGGKVMGALMRRKWMVFLPIVATLTVLSGFYLYWRASSGFASDYMGSGPGMTYGTGATAAIIAFIIGMTVTRPAMTKALELSQRMGSADAAERETIAATIAKHRSRGAAGGRIVVVLLLIAAVAMAVGRYV